MLVYFWWLIWKPLSWLFCPTLSSAVQTVSCSEFALGPMESIHRWCRVQVREILTPLFCQPLSSKAITTLPVLSSGYWDQQGNTCLLSSSPVTLFNLGSRPTSDHKNGFPGLDNPENRWQSCYGCSTEPSTHSTHCSHSDHSSAGTLWMSFHPCPHWCPFLLMQGRALCFSVLQWCRQEGVFEGYCTHVQGK